MATQFVKWWKTKFQSRTQHTSACSGYTAMSVLSSDGSDGRPSDTEDLLRDDGSSCHNGAHVNAGLASPASSDNCSTCSNDHHQQFISNQVKVEDFECDVQVEGSESGEERKEFSFTFYDLDGHGKITKDDIAGLVRSIYGAVNDSITVPHGGKKTIKVNLFIIDSDSLNTEETKDKVRLTVAPEQQLQETDLTLTQNTANNNNLSTTSSPENLVKSEMGCGISAKSRSSGVTTETTLTPTASQLRNNVNVTILENLNRHGSLRHRERYSQHRAEKTPFHSTRVPNSSFHGNCECKGCRTVLPEVIRDCGASPLRHRKKWRERHCRPDLCELIQANMAKNNVSHCCREPTLHHGKGQLHPSSSQLCTHNHLIDPNCPILPLLNNDRVVDGHNCSRNVKFSENSPEAKLFRQGSCRKHGHHRSRSHDLTENAFKHRENQYSKGDGPTHHHRCSHEERLEIVTGCVSNSAQSPKNKNTNNNNKNILNKLSTATPHQLKHRNREEDHARAMAQVINWLERESIGDKNSAAPKPYFNFQHDTTRPVPISVTNKKQEHHHIHEHIHHHYHHHYAKETPIIV